MTKPEQMLQLRALIQAYGDARATGNSLVINAVAPLLEEVLYALSSSDAASPSEQP